MIRTNRKGPLGAGLAVVALLATGAQDAVADGQRELTVAVTNLSTHLDPMGFNANVNMRVSQNVLETLIRYDFKNGTFGPGLATAWKMTSPTVMELTLREGVKCHNGEDFTAEDVATMFGPERFQGEGAPGYSVAKQYLSIIKDVRAVGQHTLEIETAVPDPLLETRLANWMSEVPCADAYRAANGWEAWGQAVVGTGPYRVAEVRPGEFHRFERFEDYYGEAAPLDGFTLTVVPEIGARIAGLLTGEFDIITEISPDQFDAISNNPNSDVVGGPIRNIRVVLFDTRHPVLSDPRVRRAMSYAIDRDLIVDSIFEGRTKVPNGFQMSAFGQMYVEDFKGVSFNPDEARRLLAEAGYKGEEISYRYLTDYYTGEVTTAQILQQMWRDVGLNVTLELKENWDQITNAKTDSGRAVANDSANAVYPDPISQLYRIYGPNGYVQKRGYWQNAAFNEASDMLYASTEPKARRAAFETMLGIYESDPPGTYLYVLPMFYGKRSSVDWAPTDTPFMDFRAGNVSLATN